VEGASADRSWKKNIQRFPPSLTSTKRGSPVLTRLEEDLDLFRTLINQSNDAIFIVDPETSRILYVNRKACANLDTPAMNC